MVLYLSTAENYLGKQSRSNNRQISTSQNILRISKSASGCTEKDEENAAVRDAYEAVPVVHCTAPQLLRRNMELLQQGRNH